MTEYPVHVKKRVVERKEARERIVRRLIQDIERQRQVVSLYKNVCMVFNRSELDILLSSLKDGRDRSC